MNNRALKFSLAANLVLICAVIVIARHRLSPATATPALVTSAPQPMAATPVAATVPRTLAELVPQLRAARVSESVLARLAAANFEERWDGLREEMQARYDDGEIDDVEMQRFCDQHDADQEKEMRSALGDEAFVQWDKNRELADMARLKLSPGESAALYQWKKQLKQAQADLNRKLQAGEIDDADYNEQLGAVQKQYDDRTKTLLGEKRFADYQNPDNDAAGNLKRSLRALDATDDQFAALLDAQRAWNEQRSALEKKYADAGTQDDAYAAQLQALDAMRDQKYQQVLGTNGVALLERQQDNNYQTLKHYQTVWQLNDAEVEHLYAAVRYYQKTVDDYRQRAQALQDGGQNVDWPAVEQNIQQFGRQAEQGLQLYLGNDRFQKIRRNEIFNFPGAAEIAAH